jgi:hypothetical protein
VSENPDDRHVVTRRDFTLESALALLAGVTITITGCGDDDDNSPGPTSPSPTPAASVTGSVSANHGHEATISGAQITSGGALSLDIRGSASHPHTVQVSSAQLQSIGARQQVAIASSTDNNHSHTVTFN